MKKVLSAFLAAALAVTLAACGEKNLALSTFSYEQELAWCESEGLRMVSGPFVNVAEAKLEDQLDAEKLAKKECTIEYTNITDYYDKSSDMWCIEFWTVEKLDNGVLIDKPGTEKQKVFLNGQGITQCIAYQTVE